MSCGFTNATLSVTSFEHQIIEPFASREEALNVLLNQTDGLTKQFYSSDRLLEEYDGFVYDHSDGKVSYEKFKRMSNFKTIDEVIQLLRQGNAVGFGGYDPCCYQNVRIIYLDNASVCDVNNTIEKGLVMEQTLEWDEYTVEDEDDQLSGPEIQRQTAEMIWKEYLLC